MSAAARVHPTLTDRPGPPASAPPQNTGLTDPPPSSNYNFGSPLPYPPADPVPGQASLPSVSPATAGPSAYVGPPPGPAVPSAAAQDPAVQSTIPPAYQATLPPGHKSHSVGPSLYPPTLGPYEGGGRYQATSGLPYPLHANHQPVMIYPSTVGQYPYQQQQQQQSAVFITQTPAGVIYQPNPQQQTTESSICAVVLSCFVTICCGCVFGIVAFILAMIAVNKDHKSPKKARRFRNASYVISVVGIVAVIVVIITCGAVYGTRNSHGNACSSRNFEIDGQCFYYRSSDYSSLSCADSTGGYYASDGYCYFNSLTICSFNEYLVDGICYTIRWPGYTSLTCSGVGYYSNGYCYQ